MRLISFWATQMRRPKGFHSTSERNVVLLPPKKQLVWDNQAGEKGKLLAHSWKSPTVVHSPRAADGILKMKLRRGLGMWQHQTTISTWRAGGGRQDGSSAGSAMQELRTGLHPGTLPASDSSSIKWSSSITHKAQSQYLANCHHSGQSSSIGSFSPTGPSRQQTDARRLCFLYRPDGHPFQSQPVPGPPLGPDCAHLHEGTNGVIPKGPPDITGIQIPALTPFWDFLPASWGRKDSRCEMGISDKGHNVLAPRDSISAGSTPSDNKRDVPVGKSLAAASGQWDYQLGGNFKKANHTRKKCCKIYCTLPTTQIQSCPLPACPDSPLCGASFPICSMGMKRNTTQVCDCIQRCRLISVLSALGLLLFFCCSIYPLGWLPSLHPPCPFNVLVNWSILLFPGPPPEGLETKPSRWQHVWML